MPTIGRTSVGASFRSLNNLAKGLRVTMTEAAAPGFSIWAHCGQGTLGETWVAALVADSDKDTVLAQSAIRTDISGARAWWEFTGGGFDSYSPANGETFLLVIASDSSTGAQATMDDAGLDGWQASSTNVAINPFNPAVLIADSARDYSIYMDYDIAVSGGGVHYLRPRVSGLPHRRVYI